ncbi:FAD-dependent oxidoreductase [Actinomyces naeslundii]|uniref:FAD-dependent oxidoreductase n=1 Tax=Actinomyces naeslundii TaxID=1655 RepID=UPI0021169B42|nr:FAD-dependent oxidoreductase [Actinomyces naeslundii]
MSAPLQGLEAWGSRCATGVQEIPQRLIVVGGVVACEAATWMSSLGNDVTMLVRGPRLLSTAESFTSRFIEKALAARGITVITDAQVVAAERPQASDTGLGRVHGGPVTVTCAGRTIEADEILVPTGRRPLPCWWFLVVGAGGWASCCGHGCRAPVLR